MVAAAAADVDEDEGRRLLLGADASCHAPPSPLGGTADAADAAAAVVCRLRGPWAANRARGGVVVVAADADAPTAATTGRARPFVLLAAADDAALTARGAGPPRSIAPPLVGR